MVLYVREKDIDKKIREYVEKNPRTTISELAKYLGIDKKQAGYYIARMIEEGELLGFPEPEKPLMRFKVEKIESIGDVVRISDKQGVNVVDLNKNNPDLRKIKKGVTVEVYEDRVEVVKE
jgi:hypothetical protein